MLTGLVQGTLDILVQRTGRQGQGTITFVQNNVFHDAFFLKAIGAFFNLEPVLPNLFILSA